MVERDGGRPNRESIHLQPTDSELVRRAHDCLDVGLRSILVLRYFSDFDSKEIGRILGLSDSTVRSRLRAGRTKLAFQLRRMGYRDE